jgi:hypothetical protein
MMHKEMISVCLHSRLLAKLSVRVTANAICIPNVKHVSEEYQLGLLYKTKVARICTINWIQDLIDINNWRQKPVERNLAF